MKGPEIPLEFLMDPRLLFMKDDSVIGLGIIEYNTNELEVPQSGPFTDRCEEV